jgi:Zn-dependent protease
MDLIISIICGLPGFAFAIMVHEAAHAFAAWKLGDPTAKSMGRISLDPRRHLDPLGVIVYVAMIVFSGGRFAFGWAKPVMVNRFNFRDPRRDFMLSSLAGPASNLLQAFVWTLLLRLYAAASPLPALLVVQRAFAMQDRIGYMIFFGIMINVVLAVFNMIPIPPLDGSRLLAWMLPENIAYHLDRLEPFGLVLVLALMYFGLLGVVFSYVAYPLLGLYLRLAVG